MKSGLFLYITNAFQQEDYSVGQIYEPDAIPFTFETIGWKICLGLLILLLSYFIFLFYRYYAAQAYKRNAIKALQHLDKQEITSVFVLLKQVAIHTYGRDKIASLYGDDWFSFLDSSSSMQPFFNPNKNIFKKALYQNEKMDQLDWNQLLSHSKRWIKHHAR